jgi:PTH1 family peptidyl-tRNA hydrolase
MLIEHVASITGVKLSRHKRALAETAETHFGFPGDRQPIVLCTPLSYMNESGGPVKAAMSFYNVEPDRLVVIHDDLDIDFDAIRIKKGGGDGGHNGLKSIRQAIGTGDYYRVRLGIGRPLGRQAPADFVLQPFASSQRAVLPAFLDRAGDAVETLVRQGLEVAQNEFNRTASGDDA